MSKIVKCSVVSIVLLIPIVYCLLFNNEYDKMLVMGNSMKPAFNDKTEILYSKNFDSTSIKKDAVVLFENSNGMVLIKRIVATGGDKVEIIDNILYVNSIKLDYDYDTDSLIAESFIKYLEVDVKTDEIFVVGDNYNFSSDSRSFGCISVDKIIGIVKE